MKKFIVFALSVVVLFSSAGCSCNKQKKGDAITEKPKNAVVSQETEKANPKDSIIGTWVVTRTEIYDSPVKSWAEQVAETYYYVGAEYEFTADGIFKNADGTIYSNYNILNDNQVRMEVVEGTRSENICEYELNGDEFVLYGHYYSDDNSNVPLGYASATYYKRKY